MEKWNGEKEVLSFDWVRKVKDFLTCGMITVSFVPTLTEDGFGYPQEEPNI